MTGQIETIAASLRCFIARGDIFELRFLKPKGRGYATFGYFDDYEKAARIAANLDGKFEGIYFTLNPVEPSLLARANNRTRTGNEATQDREILRRKWLPIDFDPERASGISSTDVEHEKAIAQAHMVAHWLKGLGWPDPVVADSGNGAHLLYRIDLPNDEPSHELVKGCLAAVADRFSGSNVKVDTSVANAARIWKLYGTLASKGDPLPDRPHRRAALVDVPQDIQIVDGELLAKLAAMAPKKASPKHQAQSAQSRPVAGDSRAKAYVQKAFDDELAEFRNSPTGTGYRSMSKAAAKLYGWVLGGYVSESEWQSQVEQAARLRNQPDKEIANALEWAKENAEKRELPPPDVPPRANGAYQPPSVDMAGILASISTATDALEKAGAVETAVMLVAKLPAIQREAAIGAIKNVAKPEMKAAAIDALLKKTLAPPEPTDSGNAEGKEDDFFRIEKGELVAGRGQDMRKVLIGGAVRWCEMVTVDDGADLENELSLELLLMNGKSKQVRVPAKDSGDVGKVVAFIRGAVGPKISVSPDMQRQLTRAIDEISRGQMSEIVEIAHTGWHETEDGLAYVTPGGVVGTLPDGHRVGGPSIDPRYAVVDEGDEAFAKGIEGLINGFGVEAWERSITLPLITFAMMPPLGKFYDTSQKIWFHLSGETGTNKTTVGQQLMALYGAKFATTPPLANFRSTVNAVEMVGWSLPDTLGLVDDYKPSLVKPRDFIDMVHRYGDQNDRRRMNANAEVKTRKAPRWWVMSTGEDVPMGEASLMARMVVLRLPRRKIGSAYNAGLGKLSRLARFQPTVMARWVEYLRTHEVGLAARVELQHQTYADYIQRNQPTAPNVNRIARNVAMMDAAWDCFGDFLIETCHQFDWFDSAMNRLGTFEEVGKQICLNQAVAAIGQKPTTQFLEALQDGIDAGVFEILDRNQLGTTALRVLAGWHDRDGFYILPQMYDEIRKRKFQSQQELGFTRQELYRLLKEEGLLVQTNEETTVPLRFGNPADQKVRRVLWLRRDALRTGGVADLDRAGDGV